MLYSAKVMDHFMNPRNVGIMEDADGVGQVGSARCGDTMKNLPEKFRTASSPGQPLKRSAAALPLLPVPWQRY